MSADYTNIEVWKQTIKQAVQYAGLNKKSASFLISDSHVDDTKMLEDISYLLNSYSIPNLYTLEEYEKINESTTAEMNVIGLEQTDANVLSMWVQTLKKNLHIFVSLSPLTHD